MSAGEYNFIVEQGAGFDRTITYRNPNKENGSPGDPVDLTGFGARMQARLSYKNAKAVIDLSTENGGLVLGGADGTIQIIINETAALDFVSAGYDLFLDPPAGEPEKLLKGTISLDRSNTHE